MSQPELGGENARPRWTGVAIAFVVLGLLIFLPAAACVVLFTGGSVTTEIFLLVLLLAGVPAAAGAALIYAGFKLRKLPPAPQGAPPGVNRPRWTGPSIAMFILGLLILVPAGLCTVSWVGVSGLANGGFLPLPFALVYGGVPMAVGAALVWAALQLRRRD